MSNAIAHTIAQHYAQALTAELARAHAVTRGLKAAGAPADQIEAARANAREIIRQADVLWELAGV